MTTDNYISFVDAKKILTNNLGKEPSNEEFWLWCFFGRNIRDSSYGIDAYASDNGWHKVNIMAWSDWGTSLSKRARTAKKWFFLRADIEAFEAKDRYLTENELVRRWATIEGSEEGAIQVIEEWYRQDDTWCPRNEGDRSPSLQNLYFGAISITQQAPNEAEMRDIALGGIFSIKDVLAVEEYLGMKEPQTEAVGDAGTTKQTKNQQRDEDYKSWIEETSLSIDDMTKADIQAELIPRNRTLWVSDFDGWVKYTKLYAGTPGRKPG